MIKPIAVIGFLVVAFVVVLSFSNSSNIETDAKVVTEEVDEEGQDFDFYVSVLGDLSIVETSIELPKSDQNDYDKYRDETNPPIVGTATPTFTLETAAILLSATGDIVSKSSFLNIPLTPAILIDDRGNLLVGSSQIKFFGRTTEDAQLNVDGTVEFWLDDKLIATKKIFTKPDGTPRKIIELFLDDSIKNTIINQVPKTFTFKFTDEPFEDLTTHTYRVIVKDFSVETISQEVRKKYNWSGEYLAYQLLINVDQSKITIQDEKNNAITVFKDDNKFIVCDLIASGNNPIQYVETKNKPPVIDVIRKNDNVKIATIDINKAQSTPNLVYDIDSTKTCAIFSELQRSTQYIFRMEGKDYEFQTPRIQQNILLTCSPIAEKRESITGYYNFDLTYVGDKCESSFAKSWDFIYNDQTNQKRKINSITLKVCGQETSVLATRLASTGFHQYLVSSQSPTFASPEVSVFDGSIMLGKIGGKPYCTYIDNLPHDKLLTFKIHQNSDTGSTTKGIISEKLISINTPSQNVFTEYYLVVNSIHNGWGNANPTELYDRGWTVGYGSNFGYGS